MTNKDVDKNITEMGEIGFRHESTQVSLMMSFREDIKDESISGAYWLLEIKGCMMQLTLITPEISTKVSMTRHLTDDLKKDVLALKRTIRNRIKGLAEAIS